MTTLPDVHTESLPDPAVITALEAIRTTPVENSMYARLYGCYTQEDTTAIAYDWDTHAPWMSLLKDIRDHCSIRWWASLGDSLVAFVNLTMITAGQTCHKRQMHPSSIAPFRSGIWIRSTIFSPVRSGTESTVRPWYHFVLPPSEQKQ